MQALYGALRWLCLNILRVLGHDFLTDLGDINVSIMLVMMCVDEHKAAFVKVAF